MIKLKALRWREYSGLSRCDPCDSRVLTVREDARTEAEVREKTKDATLLVLNIEEGAMSQGRQAATGSWRRQGNGFSPRVSRRNATLPTL